MAARKADAAAMVDALADSVRAVERGEGWEPFGMPSSNRAAVLDYVARLEAIETAAIALDKAILAQETFDCPHYEPPCACAKTGAKIDDDVEAAYTALRAALRGAAA